MAYTAYDSNKPDGSSQTGIELPVSIRSNEKALRDAIIGGMFVNFRYSQLAGIYTDEEPQYQMWQDVNGTGPNILRATNSYAAGYCVATVWELSTDTGGTWNSIVNEGRFFDGSGNLYATNNGGSIISWFHQWVGKFKALRTLYNAHAAATGTAVHGLGSMAIQSAGGVVIGGGTINSTQIGTTTPALAKFTQARSVFTTISFATPTTTIDWSVGEAFYFQASGTGAATLAFTNLPPSGSFGSITVEVVNGGLRTWTFSPATVRYPNGIATLAMSSSGRDRLVFMTRDGGSNIDCMMSKDLR